MVADRLRTGMKMFRSGSARRPRWSPPAASPPTKRSASVLHRIAFEAGTALVVPPPELCTDNGAMIAWAGAERLALGLTDTLDAARTRAGRSTRSSDSPHRKRHCCARKIDCRGAAGRTF